MNGARARTWLLSALLVALPARAADAVPVIVQSAPGRFEIAAMDSTAAQGVAALASEAWAMLAAPLSLPERFSSPVFVRLVPAAEWGDAGVERITGGTFSVRMRPNEGGSPQSTRLSEQNETFAFRVIVEPGGVVSLRVRWDETMVPAAVRRALVQALLKRLAVAHHGVSGIITAPVWLEHACLGWWRTRADAAQLDALRQASTQLTAPALGELLKWQRGDPEPRAMTTGAVWLLTCLQSESTKAGEWPALLVRLLAGEPAEAAVAAAFPGRFASDAERELWWQTSWNHLRRVNTLPTLEAAESRALLANAARFVFAREDGTDVVTPLRAVLEQAREPVVDAELTRRAAELSRVTAALHPFYRNAGLSLVTALQARQQTRADAVCAAFDSDWRDASELEAVAKAALDALEKR